MGRKKAWLLIILFFVVQSNPAWAVEYSDTSRFVQGFTKVVAAPFHAPVEVAKGLFTPFPPTGVVYGAGVGVFKTVTGLLGGVFDMAGAAAPYAKYAAPFML